MEKLQKNHFGTPMNPVPQHIINKRLPPKVLPLHYKVASSRPKITIYPSSKKITINSEKVENDTFNSPRLPMINIKKNSTNMSNQKVLRYTKIVPKYHIFKPLFQGRNKSYNFVQEEDEEYISMKNKISLLDY